MENATRFPYQGFSPKAICNLVGRTGRTEVHGHTLHFKIVGREEFIVQDGQHCWHIPFVHNGRSQLEGIWKDGVHCDGLAWDLQDDSDRRARATPVVPRWVAPWMASPHDLYATLVEMLFQIVRPEMIRQGMDPRNTSFEDDYIFDVDGNVYVSEWIAGRAA